MACSFTEIQRRKLLFQSVPKKVELPQIFKAALFLTLAQKDSQSF